MVEIIFVALEQLKTLSATMTEISVNLTRYKEKRYNPRVSRFHHEPQLIWLMQGKLVTIFSKKSVQVIRQISAEVGVWALLLLKEMCTYASKFNSFVSGHSLRT